MNVLTIAKILNTININMEINAILIAQMEQNIQ